MLWCRLIGTAVVSAALLAGCTSDSADSKTAPKTPVAKPAASAPAKGPSPTAPKAAPALAPAWVEPVAEPPCDATEARKGLTLLTDPTVDARMITSFGLAAAGMACKKHGPTFSISTAYADPKTTPAQRVRAMVDGVWRSMSLLERDCPGGEKVLNHIGGANMTGPPAQVVIGKHCRFVEKGLATQAEVEGLRETFVALVPIFRTLMTDSEVDPKVQRILLRGLLGLHSEALPTP